MMDTDTTSETAPKTVRYGLIGAGHMGREHIRNLALIPGSAVTALADPSESSLATTAAMLDDVALFQTHQGLLDSGLIDAVIIATPNDTHFAILQEIFARGENLPVLVEKPLCSSEADCDALEAAAAGYSAPVWVAMEYRYMPPVAAMLESAKAKELGELKMFTITEHRFPFLRKVDNWNRFADRTGGTLVEKACHFFDLMRLVLDDEPVRVFASGGIDVNHKDERYGDRVPDILDNAYVIVEFANGCRAMLDLCMFADGAEFQERMAIIGDKAKIECFIPASADHWPGNETKPAELEFSPRSPVGPVRTTVEVDQQLLAAGGHHGSTYYEHLGFRRVVLGEGDVEVTVHDGLKAVRMGLAAERSVRDGLSVSLRFER